MLLFYDEYLFNIGHKIDSNNNIENIRCLHKQAFKE